MMSIAQIYYPGKKKIPVRLLPSESEGLNIQYRLKAAKYSFTKIGRQLEIVPQVISNVVFGRRRSRRVEAEIARVLGKANWNEVVLEARSAITGKSVQECLDEHMDAYKMRAARQDAAYIGLLTAMQTAKAKARKKQGRAG
jgi:hypothetical protein